MPLLPLDVTVLLVLLGLLLFAVQWVTLAKLEALGWAGRFDGWGDFVAELRQGGVRFGGEDVLLAVGTVVVVLVLIGLQWRRQRLAVFAVAVFSCEKRLLWLVGLGALVLGRFYLAPGLVGRIGDAPAHISYAYQAGQTLAMGQWPIWSNWLGAGSPYLQFYGFLFFDVVAVFYWLLGDLDWALKGVMAGGHVLGAVGMYAWARWACRSRRAGLVAALGYTLCFWPTQQILIMGRLPLALFYGLLPWPFYFFEKLQLPAGRTASAWSGGIALGLLAWTHPGYAFWATVFLGIYAALRMGVRRRSRLLLPLSGLLLVVGTLFGAFLTLPMWLEREATGLHAGLSLAHIPGPTWSQLWRWSNYHFTLGPTPEHWYGGYLGLSLMGLALVGVLVPLQVRYWRRGCGPVAGVCAGLGLVLALGYDGLQALPPVRALNAGRYLVFVVPFAALAAGAGAAALGRWRRGMWGVAVALLLIDLGPTTFLHGYISATTRDSMAGVEALGVLKPEFAGLPPGQLPAYRLFTSTGGAHPQLAVGAAHVAGLPTFQTLHPGAVRAATDFGRALEGVLNEVLESLDHPAELARHPLNDVVAGGLGLVNVRHLLIQHEGHFFFNAKGLPHTPLLVTDRALPYEGGDIFAPEELPDYIRSMGIDVEKGICRQLWLRQVGQRVDLGTDPQLEVLQHRVWAQRVYLRCRLSAPGYARLAYAWYPHLEVRLNGVKVEPLQTAERFIALRLEEGEHTIELVPRLSSLRRVLLGVAGVLALAAVFYRRRAV